MNTFEIKKPSTHHGLGRVVSRITSPARMTAAARPGTRRAVRRGIGGKALRRIQIATRAEERRIAATVEAVEAGVITLSPEASHRLVETLK